MSGTITAILVLVGETGRADRWVSGNMDQAQWLGGGLRECGLWDREDVRCDGEWAKAR